VGVAGLFGPYCGGFPEWVVPTVGWVEDSVGVGEGGDAVESPIFGFLFFAPGGECSLVGCLFLVRRPKSPLTLTC
jgi:hypothetical protein